MASDCNGCLLAKTKKLRDDKQKGMNLQIKLSLATLIRVAFTGVNSNAEREPASVDPFRF
jgi:hypothetical protein